MYESNSHKRAKLKVAGKTGKTEVKLKNNQRLDATTKKKQLKSSVAEQRLILIKLFGVLRKAGSRQKFFKYHKKIWKKQCLQC